MSSVKRAAQIIVLAALGLWVLPHLLFVRVEPGQIAVRRGAAGGVEGGDLGPGWRLRIPGYHKFTYLPSSYFFLDYSTTWSRPATT